MLTSVRAKDLWIADRNFCTLKLLFGIANAKAAFVIRQHGSLVGQLLGKRRPRGRTSTGKVFEQRLQLLWGEEKRVVRRITIVLDQPTSDGDTEIHVLTNLPQSVARSAQVAELYRKRWTIEGRFYEVTQTLDCEPNTLGYPQAALFAFCLALVASNAVALMKASLCRPRRGNGGEDVALLHGVGSATNLCRDDGGVAVRSLDPVRQTHAKRVGRRAARTGRTRKAGTLSQGTARAEKAASDQKSLQEWQPRVDS